ncbi:MAG: TOBE domain-containing protein [Desulfuromonadales bacterium]|nr:TOBE domain-containing protein [Desulfuromonadales bacterium]
MNSIPGTIAAIDTDGNLSLVDIEVSSDFRMSALIVETPEHCPWLKTGHKTKILFKETEVSIARNLSGQISLRNRFTATIAAIRSSGMLAEITLDSAGHQVISIITNRSAQKMELKTGEQVEWLVKANEVSLTGS